MRTQRRARHGRPAFEVLEPRQLLSTSYYVDAASPGPAHDGSSWSAAFLNLAQALTAAFAGDTVHVAEGTYTPTTGTDRTATFRLNRNGVGVFGGYAGSAAINPDARDPAVYPTILSGDIGVAGDSADNSYHVVTCNATNSTSVLDGFSITAGMANGTGSNQSTGGGVLISSSPTISHCEISGSTAVSGGGMAITVTSARPTIDACNFSNNVAVAVPDMAVGTGGALANSGLPTLTDCTFVANTANAGGAVTSSNSPTFIDCIFVGNSATDLDDGSDAFSGTGGAAFLSTSLAGLASSPAFINCTLTQNTASFGAGIATQTPQSTPLMSNCILWGDTPVAAAEIYFDSSSPTVSHSDVQGGFVGTANIDVDPHFDRNPAPGGDGVWGTPDDDYGDLRLSLGSPCVDAGDNAAVPAGVTTDLTGNQRIFDFPGVDDPGAVVDMGAYELGFDLGPIHVTTGESLALPAGGYAFTAEQLTIDTGGSLDLANDQLTAAAMTSSIRSYLASGQLHTTSTGGALGYLDLGAGLTKVRLTLLGDTNLDGKVDVTDLGNLASSYGTPSGATWAQGDTNYDGSVDVTDLGNVATHYGASLPAVPAMRVSNAQASNTRASATLATGSLAPAVVAAQPDLAVFDMLRHRHRFQPVGNL